MSFILLVLNKLLFLQSVLLIEIEMIMKKLFTIIAVALVTMTASAQVNFGVKGGLNLSNVSLDGTLTDNLKSENQTGFFIGPTIKFTLPIVGLGMDASALYDQKSSKLSGVTVKQQAVVVPINIRYGVGLGDLASIYAFAGPQFGFNVGDKNFGDIKIGDIGNTLSEYKLKSSNLSANVGVGAVVATHLQVSLNYNIELGKTGDFNTSDAVSQVIGDAKTKSWQVALTYYF